MFEIWQKHIPLQKCHLESLYQTVSLFLCILNNLTPSIAYQKLHETSLHAEPEQPWQVEE